MTDASMWATIIGPCFTVESMARTLAWTEAEVVDAGDELRLLMLRTTDGAVLFPAFQLQHGQVIDGLTEVLRILATGTADTWTWAQWLHTELADADPPRNIDYLYAGRLDEAIRDARHDAGAWSR